jgi:hypothetical protein
MEAADFLLSRWPCMLRMLAEITAPHGEVDAVVRAAAENARSSSIEREAHLFARRAEQFLTELGPPSIQ